MTGDLRVIGSTDGNLFPALDSVSGSFTIAVGTIHLTLAITVIHGDLILGDVTGSDASVIVLQCAVRHRDAPWVGRRGSALRPSRS